jgi:hypothetical protein
LTFSPLAHVTHLLKRTAIHHTQYDPVMWMKWL